MLLGSGDPTASMLVPLVTTVPSAAGSVRSVLTAVSPVTMSLDTASAALGSPAPSAIKCAQQVAMVTSVLECVNAPTTPGVTVPTGCVSATLAGPVWTALSAAPPECMGQTADTPVSARMRLSAIRRLGPAPVERGTQANTVNRGVVLGRLGCTASSPAYAPTTSPVTPRLGAVPVSRTGQGTVATLSEREEEEAAARWSP